MLRHIIRDLILILGFLKTLHDDYCHYLPIKYDL